MKGPGERGISGALSDLVAVFCEKPTLPLTVSSHEFYKVQAALEDLAAATGVRRYEHDPQQRRWVDITELDKAELAELRARQKDYTYLVTKLDEARAEQQRLRREISDLKMSRKDIVRIGLVCLDRARKRFIAENPAVVLTGLKGDFEDEMNAELEVKKL